MLYETNVAEKRALDLLDGPTLVHVARAYIESGAPQSGSTVLTLRLSRGVSKSARMSITRTLIETYLQAEDGYRADLVLDYFEKTFGAEAQWEVALNRAELALLDGRPQATLKLIRDLKTPAGDPEQRQLELTARAHLALEEPFPAAEAHLAALNLPIPAEPERPEDLVRVLSACARAGVDGPCGALYRAASTKIDLGPRLRAHAERLRWLASGDAASPSNPNSLAEMLVRSGRSEAKEITE